MDLKVYLNELLKFIERTIPEHIEIQSQFSRGNYTINADPTQLQQMITNLTVNARDAMPNGGTLIFNLSHLTIESGDILPVSTMTTGKWIRLAITDSGAGMSAEVIPHIFEPFFTTKGVGNGSGLGLAQVYGIVKQHNGCINVESDVGVGTTFSVYFPVVVPKTDEQSDDSTENTIQGNGDLILVVEDDESLLGAIHATLEFINYRVLTAKDGKEGLMVYQAHAEEIDLILSDVVMPKMDGFDLVAALQQEPRMPHMVLMSGFPRDRVIQPEMRSFISGWLPKPLDMQKLATLLHTLLQ